MYLVSLRFIEKKLFIKKKFDRYVAHNTEKEKESAVNNVISSGQKWIDQCITPGVIGSISKNMCTSQSHYKVDEKKEKESKQSLLQKTEDRILDTEIWKTLEMSDQQSKVSRELEKAFTRISLHEKEHQSTKRDSESNDQNAAQEKYERLDSPKFQTYNRPTPGEVNELKESLAFTQSVETKSATRRISAPLTSSVSEPNTRPHLSTPGRSRTLPNIMTANVISISFLPS